MNRSDACGFQERYGRIIDVVTDGVLVISPDDRVLLANAAALRLLGVAEGPDDGGRPPGWHLLDRTGHPIPPEQYPFAQCRRTGQPVRRAPVGLRRPDGTLVQLSVRCVPDNVEPGNVVMVLAETTGRGDAERTLKKLRELETQLARTQRLATVGILAGNIAHDFNNLLTIIGCNVASVLDAIPETDPIRRHLLDVQEASDQGAELTRDLLSFSRPTKPRAIICDLSEAAAEAVRLMRRAMPPDIELRTEFASEPLMLRGDPSQLHQIVVNLCMNARETMSEGGALTLCTSGRILDDVSGSASPDVREAEFVVLGLESTAWRVNREVLAQAFEPDSTPAVPGRGTGLELAIVGNIARAHHGWVEVESPPDKGTRVEVYFPSRTAREDEPQRAVDPGSLRGAGTVLVADGEVMITALMRSVLESRGYQTLTAHTANEAITMFEAHHRSVVAVVLDGNLPKVGGVGLFDRLREAVPDVPIVLISGSMPIADEESVPADQSTRFIAKPFTPTELLEALKSMRRTAPGSPA